MAEHSRGPWRSEVNPDGLDMVVDADSRWVCLGITNESDAPLLAAAPELLEAAILAENWLAGVSMKDMPQCPTEPRGFGRTYSKIYSAIVKATGGKHG